MRISSLVSAFLLMIIGFAAAAAVPPNNTVVPSCTAGSGNDAALQCITNVISNTTAHLQPLADKLAASAKSGTPDADTVHQIIGVISTSVEQLSNAVPLNGLPSDGNITNLIETLNKVINNLPVVEGVVGQLVMIVDGLLSTVTKLLGGLIGGDGGGLGVLGIAIR